MTKAIPKAAEEKRVSMNIARSTEDKKLLNIYAAEHDTTVAAVIAECVEKLRKEAEHHGR